MIPGVSRSPKCRTRSVSDRSPSRVGRPAAQGIVKPCGHAHRHPSARPGTGDGSRRGRHRPAGPPHEEPDQAAAPRRHRRHRSRRHRPGQRRRPRRLPGRRRGQRRAEHLRPLSQPRPRDPHQRRHPAARQRRQGRVRQGQGGRAGPPRRRPAPGRGRRGARRGPRARPRHRRDGDERGQGGAVHAARGVRHQHDGVHEAGARAPARRRRRARRRDLDRGPARPGRRPWVRLQGGPARPPPLHPRLPAGAHRRRRRRGRAPGGRLPAGHDRRRHGLGERRLAHLRGRGRRPRLRRRARARAWPGCRTSASRRSPSPRRPPARTSRCCSPTRRAPPSSSPSARTPPWSSSWTRAAAAWPRPSSPDCAWAASSSTPRV